MVNIAMPKGKRSDCCKANTRRKKASYQLLRVLDVRYSSLSWI